MATSVFLTVDTEFVWRHHRAGLDVATIYARSLEPAGVGLGYQLRQLARHDLKACFFVDPMQALVYGMDPLTRTVETILAAGQEVQLHCHASWTGASVDDRLVFGRPDLIDYSRAEQIELLARARDLLMRAGAPRPVAFRAGSYAANDDTLAALASLGFAYDSSHNGAYRNSNIGLPARAIAPVERFVTEVPVTLVEPRPGMLRTFQICALSTAESNAALRHAVANGHAAVTIVSHSFELATRTGTAANAVHVRRFERLCGRLAAMREVLPTRHFADRPPLALGQLNAPLPPNVLRTRWRQAEQLWSNWVAERAG